MAINEYTTHFSSVLNYLIAEFARKKGLTLNEIADTIGISRAALSKYQNNEAEPGITAVVKIARYFNVSCDYLLGTTTEMATENAVNADITPIIRKLTQIQNTPTLTEEERERYLKTILLLLDFQKTDIVPQISLLLEDNSFVELQESQEYIEMISNMLTASNRAKNIEKYLNIFQQIQDTHLYTVQQHVCDELKIIYEETTNAQKDKRQE
ncbi:MAG: helix-turn-helix transcriptional regulator [Clostridia bacterium]|nr:helix-turn-helix transcriptional regulator [Clostridia bacterium]